MPHFAQQRNGLQPAKTFFDALPLLLTDGIARVSRRATIDGAAASSPKILRHVRRHPKVPALAHEIRRVEALVAAHRHAPASWNFLQHFQRGIALGRARGFPYSAVHNQAVAILHQQISAVAQLGLLARTFARHLRFWIAFRFVRFVRALLAAIIHRGISRIIRRRRTLLVLGLKTLRAGPSFQQTSVKREVAFVYYARSELCVTVRRVEFLRMGHPLCDYSPVLQSPILRPLICDISVTPPSVEVIVVSKLSPP